MADEPKKKGDSVVLGCMILSIVFFFFSLGLWKFVELVNIIIRYYHHG
jgi:hypothetical protein